MINTTLFKQLHLGDKKGKKVSRTAARGMIPFMCDLYDEIQQHRNISSYLELGISGGNSHQKYAESSPDLNIYGIDIISRDEDLSKYHKSYHDMFKYSDILLDKFPNVKFMWGTNAYSEDTPAKCQSEWGLNNFDIILDDAATDWPRMENSLPLWKQYTNLAYITLVPDGMGVESWWNRTETERAEIYKKLATYGMTIFNLEEFKIIVPGQEQAWNAHYLGVWLPDYSLSKNTFEKYRKYIVAGEENEKL